MTPRARLIANELGDYVKMKYSVPPNSFPDTTSEMQGVPLNLLWLAISELTGKSISDLAEHGVDGEPV